MATIRLPRPSERAGGVFSSISNVFWIACGAAVILYAFFVALGAFSPGDIVGVSVGVGILAVLWAIHAWTTRTHKVALDLCWSCRDSAVANVKSE